MILSALLLAFTSSVTSSVTASVTPQNRFFTVPAAPPTATLVKITTEISVRRGYQAEILGDFGVPGIVTFNAGNSFERRKVFIGSSTVPALDTYCSVLPVQIMLSGHDIYRFTTYDTASTNVTISINTTDFSVPTTFGVYFESQYSTVFTSGITGTRQIKMQETLVTVEFI